MYHNSTYFNGSSSNRAQEGPHGHLPDVYENDPYYEFSPQEQIFPLDAFDEALLRQPTAAVEWHGNQPLRSSLFAPHPLVTSKNHEVQELQDTRHRIQPSLSSNSSPIQLVSSPTIVALRNRQNAAQRSSQVHQEIMPRTPQGTIKPVQESFPVKSLLRPSALSLKHAPPIIQGIQLVETMRLPDKFRSIFSFPLFNAVQSKCFQHAYESENNIVVSAPTGSGKTAIMELAICRLLLNRAGDDFKVVYQAPTKSLCSERFRDWQTKFSTLGLRCAELTGDVEHAQLKHVQSANVIIATPEKWDSVTRKWKDNAKLMRMVKLFLVDEVHILKESRGATLEAVVSRMKSIDSSVRFIALSATVPNSEDIATWLGLSATTPERPAIREVFGEEFRPVLLEKHVIGFQSQSNDFILDTILSKEIPTYIAKFGKRKPVMIFCATKKSAAKTAMALARLFEATAPKSRLWNAPKGQIKTTDQDLQGVVRCAVAYHHSGLDAADRQAVENGFLNGDINIICSTSTLAVGVNLPCYLVILQGTVCYTDIGLQEYSSLEVMQMLGRAGRPQFETSACAVILTNREKISRYEKMISGQESLESCLHLNLIEHLNAEIGTGTVYDLNSALKWLQSTFMFVRMQQNPGHYRNCGTSRSGETLLLEDLCNRNTEMLLNTKLISNTNAAFRSTEIGDAMARYYVKYETMKVFVSLPPKAKMSEILTALCQAAEFKEVRWRTGEKSLYKTINKSNDIRHPIKVNIDLPAHKVSLVVQAQLGGLVFDKDANKKHGIYFKQDVLMVLNHCNRLIRCVIDIQLYLEDATAAKNALELGRSLAAGVWDNTPMQLKQIEGIGEVTARKLASAGINSIDTLLHTEAERIDLVMGKNQPYGSNMLKKVATFPDLRVTVKEVGKKRKTDMTVEIQLCCEIGFLNQALPVFFNRKHVYICFVCETSYGRLIDFRRFSANRLAGGESIMLTAILDQVADHISCHVMCDEIAGTHRYAELELKLSPSWFPDRSSIQADHLRHNNEDTTATGDFDDADLADEDFLNLETNGVFEEIIVDDIDDILAEQKQPERSKQSKKRKTGNMNDISKWKEPIQLDNGNWTCQHNCKDENLQCNHLCCKQGVKNPKKRPKLISGMDENTSKALHKEVKHKTEVKNVSQGSKSIAEMLTANSKHQHCQNKAESHDTRPEYPNIQTTTNKASKKESNSPTDKSLIPYGRKLQNSLPVSEVFHHKVATDGIPDLGSNQHTRRCDYGGMPSTELFDFSDCDSLTDLTPEDVQFFTDYESTPDVKQSCQADNIRHLEERSPKYPNRVSESENSKSQPICDEQANGKEFSASKSSLDQAGKGQNLHVSDSQGLLIDDDYDDLSELDDVDYLLLNHDTSTMNVPHPTKKDTSRQCITKEAGDSQQTIGDTASNSVTDINSKETEVQRTERLYKEDQRKKWKDFDPKLFEKFSSFVEII